MYVFVFHGISEEKAAKKTKSHRKSSSSSKDPPTTSSSAAAAHSTTASESRRRSPSVCSDRSDHSVRVKSSSAAADRHKHSSKSKTTSASSSNATTSNHSYQPTANLITPQGANRQVSTAYDVRGGDNHPLVIACVGARTRTVAAVTDQQLVYCIRTICQLTRCAVRIIDMLSVETQVWIRET